MKKIILASNSPRRKEILSKGNINFEIKTSECKEIYSELYDEKVVKENSIIKASAVLKEVDEPALIIGADTIVILDNVCLVKPHNIYEAFFMLKKLSNKTHYVITSHTIIDSETKNSLTKISTSEVTFRKLNSFEIIKYIFDKKPFDKAGSYGIQDFISENNINSIPEKSFIKSLKGSYYNVMGLDLDLVTEMLTNF